MTSCPTCGHDPDRRFKNELEMQHPTRAGELQAAAARCGEEPEPIGHGCIGWRGLVWHQIRCRKATICIRSGMTIVPGELAWRQLSEVRNRDWRVREDAWGTMDAPAGPSQGELPI